MPKSRFGAVRYFLLMAFSCLLVSCADGIKMEQDFIVKDPSTGDIMTDSELAKINKERGAFFGSTFDNLLGNEKKKSKPYGPSIEVSALLWRASLDTISFMPLKSADPFGGVIITDWYVPAETPNERVKLTVYILTRQLRSDGIRVSVFRETLQGSVWRTAPVNKETAIKLENKILYRARELRIDSRKN